MNFVWILNKLTEDPSKTLAAVPVCAALARRAAWPDAGTDHIAAPPQLPGTDASSVSGGAVRGDPVAAQSLWEDR